MSLEALGKKDYAKAKNYAVLAAMYNKRTAGIMDSQISDLYGKAGTIAGGMMSSADNRAAKTHYFAAYQEYEEVASNFTYVDQGAEAKQKMADLKASLRGKNISELMTAEAEDTFQELMAFLSESWTKNNSVAPEGKLEAVDIVRTMSDTERIELKEMIELMASLYRQTEYGQKALKLKNDIRMARIKMD